MSDDVIWTRYVQIASSAGVAGLKTKCVTDWLNIDYMIDGAVYGYEVLGNHSEAEVVLALLGWKP